MNKTITRAVLAAIILLIAIGTIIYWQNPGEITDPEGTASAAPTISATPENGQPSTNSTGLPLKLPDDVSFSFFAKDLPGVRVMVIDPMGNMLVSRPAAGVITMLEIENDQVVRTNDVIRGLNQPHGLALDPDEPLTLYFAETDKISRVRLYSDQTPEKIADLPLGGRHFTRTLIFGPDKRLYVSIGSSCDVCDESDPRRAKIFAMDKDGKNFKEYARGLRNSVFMAINPADNKIWATEMGRDLLGDNLPPDEINIIEPSITLGVKNYGWPVCYGQNIHDTVFDKKTYVRNPCQAPLETAAHIDIPAHSAPLGLAFIPANSTWPRDYQGDLLVAYHGSWNRSVPTGYMIVRLKLDDNGNYSGSEDFISGWLTPTNQVLGRPVALLFDTDGSLYISDDKAGVIYKANHDTNQ